MIIYRVINMIALSWINCTFFFLFWALAFALIPGISLAWKNNLSNMESSLMNALGIAGFELEKNLRKSLCNPADVRLVSCCCADITFKKMIRHLHKRAMPSGLQMLDYFFIWFAYNMHNYLNYFCVCFYLKIGFTETVILIAGHSNMQVSQTECLNSSIL